MPGFIPLESSDNYLLLDSDSEDLLVQTDQLSVGFCVSSAETNRLDKTAYLSEMEWIAGTLRDESSVVNPTLILEYASFPAWNYAYIPAFNRYYFIAEITSVRMGLWRISFREDPLMSHKDAIKNTEAMIARNEFDFDERVNDELYPTLYGKDVYEDWGFTSGATIKFEPDVNFWATSKRHIAVTTLVDFKGNDVNADPASPDPGYLPKVVSGNFAGVGTYQTYAMTDLEYLKLSQYLIKNGQYSSFVISAIDYPYQLPFDAASADVFVRLGKAGVLDPSNDPPILYSKSLTSPYLTYAVLGHIYHSTGEDFKNYEPYATLEVYVPYAGWVKIPLEVVATPYGQHKIICYYAIDHINGSATAYLYDKTAHRMIWSSPAQLGVKLAINSTNAYENRRTENANDANMALASLGSALSVAVGVITQNPIGIIGGIMGETTAIAKYNITKNSIVDRAQASAAAGATSTSTVQRLRYRVTRMKSDVYSLSAFAHQYGRPLNAIRQIGILSGHTVVSSVHLEIAGAYPAEVDAIESILKEGFIA